MTVARSAAEVPNGHVAMEPECLDRLYVNAYVPLLQNGAGASYLFRENRGNPVPSSALMAPMTRSVVASIERFARDEGLEIVSFPRGERKDGRTRERLRDRDGGEGVLYIGKAQEPARVVRTERRQAPMSGTGYPWLVSRTAMVNQHYFYVFDENFGPLFVKFCSYFPYSAKLCLNGQEYLKRQLAKRGIGFEELHKASKAVIERFHAKSGRGVRQELYAACTPVSLARQFVNRRDRDLNSTESEGIPAMRANFNNALRLIGREIGAIFPRPSEMVNQSVRRIMAGLSRCIQRERPGRSYPRESKQPRSKWLRRAPA